MQEVKGKKDGETRQRDNARDGEEKKSGEERIMETVKRKRKAATHWSSRGPACEHRAAWCGSSYSRLVY